LGLAPQILKRLQTLNFVTPTPIQAAAIPVALNNHDMIGIAQTGTGKTLAFGLPILHKLLTSKYKGRALIILPTRELALQVEESLGNVARGLGLRGAVLIGGAPIRPQRQALSANPDIIIATPGRLIDHLNEGYVDLRTVETLVLDEADRMLDMGFLPQIKQILRAVPEERQTLLFSATMPAEVENIANNYMYEPIRVEIARAGTTAEGVTQELFVVPQEEKNELLAEVLGTNPGSTLIFTRTRSRAHRVARVLKTLGYSAAEIHADRTLAQRRQALDGFKSGAYRILVATDIAARGIDVTGIELVINYDLPDCADDYVHRIGRTARAGRTGIAMTFASPDQAKDVRAIEKLIRSELPLSPNSPGELPVLAAERPHPRSRRGNGGRPRNNTGAPAARGSRVSTGRTHRGGPRPSSSQGR
jgi:ATP-dependent RNA helicase RhlE